MTSLNRMVDVIQQNQYQVLVIVYALAELMTFLCMSISAGGGIARILLFFDIFTLTFFAGIAFKKTWLLLAYAVFNASRFIFYVYQCFYYVYFAIKMPMHTVFKTSAKFRLSKKQVRSLFLIYVIVYGAAAIVLLVIQWMVYKIIVQLKNNGEKKSSVQYDRTSTLPLCSAMNMA